MGKEHREGVFVVIEGPDASGKETQTGRIVEWLRNSEETKIDPEVEQEIIERLPGSYPDPSSEKVKDNLRGGVWRLSFPTYDQTPGGRVVKAYLNGGFGDRSELDMEKIVDIYAADRKQFKEMIAKYLEEGGIIVCDRYREANLIHQLVGFKGDEWEEKFEYIKGVDEDLPDADQVFYLDISPEEAKKRMADREKDIHEEDEKYMKKVNSNGKKVAEKESWILIDAERSRREIENDLREKIREIL